MLEPSSTDLPRESITFRASFGTLRKPVAGLVVIAAVGSLLLWFAIAQPLGDWSAVPRYSPGGTIAVAGWLIAASLAGLGYYWWLCRRPDGKVGGLTLSPTGLDFRVQPMTARHRQSIAWQRVDSWHVAGDPTRPVIEIRLRDRRDGGSQETATLPIHLLQDDRDDVIAAFARYCGDPDQA